MKRANFTNRLVAMVILMVAMWQVGFSQATVNMPYNTPGGTFTTGPGCTFFNFYDNGGSAANYTVSSAATSEITFVPSNAATRRVRANFSVFATEAGWDALYVFNGAITQNGTATSPLIAATDASFQANCTTAAGVAAGGATTGGFPAGGFQGGALQGQSVTATNAAGALSFRFRSDASVTFAGWAAVVDEVPLASAVATIASPLATITVSTGPNDCGTSATVPVPSVTGTSAGLTLQYSLAGGAFQTAGVMPVAGSVTIPVAGQGTYVLCWRLVDLTCAGHTFIHSQSSQTIIVADQIPPVITCPANQVINLDPGLCDAIINYDVTATDNCGNTLFQPFHQATTVDSTNFSGFVPFCGGGTGDLWVGKRFKWTGTGTLNITQLRPGVTSATAGTTVPYNIYRVPSASATALANFTLVKAGTYTFPATVANAIVTIPVTGAAIPQGNDFYVEFDEIDASSFRCGYTTAGDLAPSVTDVRQCIATFIPGPSPLAVIGGGFATSFFILSAQGVAGNISLTQTAGLPSGSTFPRGTTTNCFLARDASNNTASCCFTVQVKEYANPTHTLACHDNVEVSLDATCQHLLQAQTMLAGGPYGCYSDYLVQIQRNGVYTNNLITAADINQTLLVQVTDDSTNNKCWGHITVEDKLPPVITCDSITIPCNANTLPGQIAAQDKSYARSFNPAGSLPDASSVSYSQNVSIPTTTFNKVKVHLVFTHSWIGDVTMRLQAPSGTQVQLINRPQNGAGGCNNNSINFDVTFDDAATVLFDGQCNANATAMTGSYLPTAPLAGFNGQNPNGTWTLNYTDAVGGDSGNISLFEILINANLPITSASAVDCDLTSLTYADNFTDLACGGPSGRILRTWTAADGSGHTASCVQQITLKRPTVNDVSWPHNYDDLDLPAFNCGTNVVTTPGVTGYPQVFGQNIVNGTICDFTQSYVDQVIDICAGAYKILRVWTVIDWCTSTVLNHNQIIKVLDKTAPSITCPGDITISTQVNSCVGAYQTNIVSTDGCSSASQLTNWVTASNGQVLANGLIVNLPLGPTVVTYHSKDNCGNEGTCSFTITVEDQVKPTPVCDQNTVVTLTNDGTAIIYATTFDDGSHDNCGIDHFEVRRDAPSFIDCSQDVLNDYFQNYVGFGPYTKYWCCDIGSVIMTTLRVWDIHGNYNDCMVLVHVQDKTDPICIAPANKTIYCDEGYNLWDLEQFGQPTIYDNCEFDTTYTRIWNIDQCHKGTISRSWSVTDPSNNQAFCSQIITVLHHSDFVVDFPEDVTFTDCNLGALIDAKVYDDDCELVAISKVDDLFNIVPDACYKIVRTWTAVNWCIYDPNNPNNNPAGSVLNAPLHIWRDGVNFGPNFGYPNGSGVADGYMQYKQIIKILDNVPPTITSSCADVTFCDQTTGCDGIATLTVEATDACSPLAALKYHYRIWSNYGTANASLISQGYTADASGNFPYGTYHIKWEVEDGCGNVSWCEYNFTVQDCKKPSIVCINGLSAELMAMDVDNNPNTPAVGMVEIWDTEFLASWSDNCTPTNQLKLRVRRVDAPGDHTVPPTTKSVVFTCDDLANNPNLVELWAGDNAGNWDFCQTYVLVQNNMNVCGPQTASVSGAVTTEATEGVQNATINISGPNGIPTGTATTGVNGTYLTAVPSVTGQVVSGEKNNDPLNGVSTFDLVLIQRHILGTSLLGSPYKIIAADANKSGSVTTFDIVQLRQLILHTISALPNNKSWRFVDKNYVFPSATNPFAADFPEVINVTSATANNFVGVKVGDVNGSAVANQLLGTEDRTMTGTLKLNAEDANLNAGDVYTVNVKAGDFNVNGYQFTLNYDNSALELADVKGIAKDIDASNFGIFADKGMITTSYSSDNEVKNGDVLFSLTFKAIQAVQLSKALKVSSELTQAEAYGKDGLQDVSLNFNNASSTAAFELYQNTPNPYKGSTVIGFNLPQATTATLKIYDAAGRMLRVIEGNYAKGYNSVSLNSADFSITGVLYYELSTATETATKKMIIME